MAKTNIFVEDAATSNELAYIKTSQNLLNKVTTQANCDAFIAAELVAPYTYADPWQIVFLEARDTIWTQGNEYGTSEAEITAITNRLTAIDGANGRLETIEGRLDNHDSLITALRTLVGAKPIDSRLQDPVDGSYGGENTTVVKALTNVANNLDSLNGRLNSLEKKGVAITEENDAYLKITQSGTDVVTYTLATENLMSYTDINAAISGAIDNFNTNTVSPLADRLDTKDAELAAYLEGLKTTDGTNTTYHPTVADYVTTYVSYAISQVNSEASALGDRVETIENNMTSYHRDIEELKTAYIVTAYQGNTVVTTANLTNGALTLKQNGKDIVTINVPVDMVLKEGQLITATADDVAINSNVIAGEKYIKLVLNDNNNQSSTSNPIYIAVKDLVDLYDVENSSTVNLSKSTREVNGARVSYITANITEKYVGYMDGAIKGVSLATGTNEGHIALTYTRNDTTTGTADIDLTSKFATKAQGDLADTALQTVYINGQPLTKSSYSYVLNGDNINVSYNTAGTAGTATTGTLNEAIADIEKKIKNAQEAGVQSITGEGVTVSPSTGNVTITATGSTVKSETLTGTAYAKSNETIDANLTYIDKQVQTNAANIQTNANDIAAIKAALNWTIIG